MLSSYFDRSCDSHSLFDDKKIALTADYEKNLNGYNVIYLDMSDFVLEAKEKEDRLRTYLSLSKLLSLKI